MTHIEWQFGGWLHAWPEAAALGVLGAVAAAGLLGIVWSYRHAAGGLTPRGRWSLAALRAAIVLLILACLANPMRVEKSALPQKTPHTLAVLVDRSASMSAPDFRGETRLASALRRWRQVEPRAKANFATVRYSRFAGDVQPADSLEDAANQGAPGAETHLFAALRQTLAENPAAIVCLTDGLDTSSDDPAKFTAEAAERGVPVYFVPGENHLLPGASLALREIKAPSRVLRKSQFTATALLESIVARDQELPVELWVNGKKWAAARLPVRAGRNALSWPVKVDSGETGALSLEFRAGDQSASCTTAVMESRTVDVMYYQGALQWGYRFLRGALESDPSFRLTAIVNPALHVQLAASPAGGLDPVDLPEDAAELRRFQVVVLAHVFAAQLTSRQQQALVDYVRRGGSLLFISPDTTATEQFSGTALEQVLPVVFETPGTSETPAQQMQLQLSANAAQANDFFAGGNQNISLKPFALPPGLPHTAASDLFAGTNGEPLPKFNENAKVHALKPGAEALAVNGRDPADVLLARQQFGDGFAAALNTDLLWRWKMSLPSSSHAVEKFWQQLLLSLAPETGEGFRLTRLTASAAVNAPVVFSVDNAAAAESLRIEAVSPSGTHQPLTVTEVQDADGSSFRTSFTPPKTGRWEVRATDASGRAAGLTFPVAEKSSSAELSNLPADVAGMGQLAESTGGSLIDANTVLEPPAESAGKPTERLPQALWNSGPVWLVLLGLYATELILRRRWKLL
jgi:hypothetical protein